MTSRLAWLVTVLTLATAFVVGANAQQRREAPPQRKGTASVVIHARTKAGRPVSGVRLTAITVDPPRETWNVTSGADGIMSLVSLPAGRFRLHVTHPSLIVDPAVRLTGLNGGLSELEERKVLKHTVEFQRGGVITGTAFDPTGDPMPDVLVRAYKVGEDGALIPAAGQTYRSNDVGVYRIAGLAGGAYLVSATYRRVTGSRDDGMEGFAPTWYPNQASPSGAMHVKVEPEREAAGIDIQLAASRFSIVEGIVRDPLGAPVGGVQLSLIPRENGPLLRSQPGTRSGAAGTFRFTEVPPGEYALRAVWHRNESRPSPSVSAQDTVQFSTSSVMIDGTTGRIKLPDIYLLQAPRIGGSIHAQGAKFQSKGISIVAVPVGTRALAGESLGFPTLDEQKFSIPVIPGKFVLRVRGLPPGLHLQRVSVNGRDVTNSGVDVTAAGIDGWTIALGTSASGLTGTVATPQEGTSVIVISENQEMWKQILDGVKLASVDRSGQFSIAGLARIIHQSGNSLPESPTRASRSGAAM